MNPTPSPEAKVSRLPEDRSAPPGGALAALQDHPDRTPAQAEIHARPISPLTAPARVRRVAMLHGQDPAAVHQSRARVAEFCRRNEIALPDGDARRINFTTSAHEVTWEFHTEFSTVTWTSRLDDLEPWPSGVGLEAAGPDLVALAVRIDLVATSVITGAALAGFDERSLCYATAEQGRAQVATDFLLDRHGYGRYEVAAGSLGPYLLGTLVRRLLEIETYRVLTLVGIGLARSEAPRLGRMETRLAGAMREIVAATDPTKSAGLLDVVHDLQLEAAGSDERTRYRFAASRAYGDILLQRLRDLDERPNGEHSTLQTFLRQRIEPALSTFKAIERRQNALLEQTARSTAVLGTRISLDIDTQNRSILETISNTARSQFNLQRTVEGLSTIAIVYYLLGILNYASHGLAQDYDHAKAITMAVLAPVLVIGVWFYLKRVQKH